MYFLYEATIEGVTLQNVKFYLLLVVFGMFWKVHMTFPEVGQGDL